MGLPLPSRRGRVLTVRSGRSLWAILQGGIWMTGIALTLLVMIVAPLLFVPLALSIGMLRLRLVTDRPLPPPPPTGSFRWQDHKTLVVVSSCCERHSVSDLLDQLLQHDDDLHVLVVDASPLHEHVPAVQVSQDHDLARVHVLTQSVPVNPSEVLSAGLRWAVSADYEQILHMNADGSDKVDLVSSLLEGLGSADLVVASRRMAADVAHDGVSDRPRLLNFVRSRCENWCANVTLKMWSFDSTAGFRAWRAPLLHAVLADGPLLHPALAHVELLLRATRRRATIAEVLVAFASPRRGERPMPKTSLLHTLIGIATLRRRYSAARA